MRSDPFDAQKTDQHDYENFDRADKLSVRRQFLKFNIRAADRELLREVILEYLTNQGEKSGHHAKINNLLDLPNSSDSSENVRE